MGNHVLPLDVLLALAALGLAECALCRIEVLPAIPGEELHARSLQGLRDVLFGSVGELACLGVVKQHADGLGGIGLGVADEAHRAALDPASGVEARDDGAVELGDVAAVVVDDVLLGVERNGVDSVGAVAHSEVDRLNRPLGELAGPRDGAVAVEGGALGLDAGDLAILAEDLNRLLEQVNLQGVWCFLRFADGVALQGLANQILGLRVGACLEEASS